jgi:DNA-binding cell septation regulator SpoVG
LSKISRLIPKLQKGNGLKSSKKNSAKMFKDQNTDVLVTNQTLHKLNGHPRFQYHRVNDSTGLDKLSAPNNGKRITSIKGNEGNQSIKRSIVAISLSPSTVVSEDKIVEGTTKTFEEMPQKPCKLKKNQNLWKHKQRQLDYSSKKDTKSVESEMSLLSFP